MITVETRHVPVDWLALRRTGAPALTPSVPGAPLLVRDADSGAPLVLVTRLPDERLLERFRQAVAAYPRGQVARVNLGVIGPCSSFGYQAVNTLTRRNSCRTCGPARTHPNEHAAVCGLAEPLFSTLSTHLPDVAGPDLTLAGERILPEWRLDATPWTSGVINFDSPLPYHRDTNNLDCWSVMVVVRRKVSGGNLHIPELDLVLPCRDGEAIFFPGWRYIHGVTPLRVKPGGYRTSAVFYTVKKMQACAPGGEELERAQARRSATEDPGWRERQVAFGLLDESPA